ncbi:uncharacterized protein SPPG_03292 [Spizellomyces punctatus DAOM BR117]|uniref:Protein phosphatase inhibitor 2 n=1 Tax=Spizellomyces punctatus (strain DAOM BR117) TaxID=645134 RepID=A0A0L0HK56_SPIPD|nr:uncharacterized protein SPPG_03292 [Spizellomyces punctatus DAOM BR117]KND01492.1 hypothetical protein SPPG_03292 [Spizellomyces punctatus DAOM BR117]|eukprot:XP_016609531.1 hypothetical protein SPPG_03292 [Spizellomyces punctatus DAOM BR117]
MDAHHQPRGILKKPVDPTTPSRGIRWDEDNIMLTESQKGNTMKITEPKTPYIRYDSENDMILGSTGNVPPMELSDAIYSAQRSPGSTASLSDTESSGSGRRHVSVDDWDDSGDEKGEMDPEEAERHRKFEALRSQHYNMKEALRKGRELAAKTTEGNKDTANIGNGVGQEDDEAPEYDSHSDLDDGTSLPGLENEVHEPTSGLANLRLSGMPAGRVGLGSLAAFKKQREANGDGMDMP